MHIILMKSFRNIEFKYFKYKNTILSYVIFFVIFDIKIIYTIILF